MSSKNILKLMKDKEIEFVDFRFTDPRGKLQHLTMDATIVDDEMLEEGVFFDGSTRSSAACRMRSCSGGMAITPWPSS